jgi:hypothetical protein
MEKWNKVKVSDFISLSRAPESGFWSFTIAEKEMPKGE